MTAPPQDRTCAACGHTGHGTPHCTTRTCQWWQCRHCNHLNDGTGRHSCGLAPDQCPCQKKGSSR